MPKEAIGKYFLFFNFSFSLSRYNNRPREFIQHKAKLQMPTRMPMKYLFEIEGCS